MKKAMIAVVTVILLVGCSEQTLEDDEFEYDEDGAIKGISEVIDEKDLDVLLVDNDDLSMTLKRSEITRKEDHETWDILTLTFNVVNKRNRTFKILLEDISVDGDMRQNNVGMLDNEIEPEERKNIEITISVDSIEDDKKFTFDEHISGELIYSDYERGMMKEYFNEYIIEQ